MASDPNKHPQPALTRSELVADITRHQPQLSEQDVELAVNSIMERMTSALAKGERIEIRGFGSMTLHYRPPRIGRNPRTGEKVQVAEKYVPHFKPGVDLRKRVNTISPAAAGHGEPDGEQ